MDSDLGWKLNLWGTGFEALGVVLSLTQLVLYDVRTSNPTRAGRLVEAVVRTSGAWLRDHRAVAAVAVFLIVAATIGSNLDDLILGEDPSVAVLAIGSVVEYVTLLLFIAYLIPQLGSALEYLSNNLRTSLTATGVLFGLGVVMQFIAVWQYG